MVRVGFTAAVVARSGNNGMVRAAALWIGTRLVRAVAIAIACLIVWLMLIVLVRAVGSGARAGVCALVAKSGRHEDLVVAQEVAHRLRVLGRERRERLAVRGDADADLLRVPMLRACDLMCGRERLELRPRVQRLRPGQLRRLRRPVAHETLEERGAGGAHAAPQSRTTRRVGAREGDAAREAIGRVQVALAVVALGGGGGGARGCGTGAAGGAVHWDLAEFDAER